MNFEEILLRASGNFEAQNKALESSISSLIIIDAYNCIIIIVLINASSRNAIRKKMWR